jgi:hypothetical protein
MYRVVYIIPYYELQKHSRMLLKHAIQIKFQHVTCCQIHQRFRTGRNFRRLALTVLKPLKMEWAQRFFVDTLSRDRVWLRPGSGSMTAFIGLFDRARNYTLQFTITDTLVSTVTSSLPLLVLLITSRHGLRRRRLFHYYCILLLLWKHSCLWSRYLAMADVELLISRSLPSNVSTCHNILEAFFRLIKVCYTTALSPVRHIQSHIEHLKNKFRRTWLCRSWQVWVRMSHYFSSDFCELIQTAHSKWTILYVVTIMKLYAFKTYFVRYLWHGYNVNMAASPVLKIMSVSCRLIYVVQPHRSPSCSLKFLR